MATTQVLGGPVELNTSVLTGAAVIVGIGAAIVGIGAVVGGLSLVGSARRWAAGVERSPVEIVQAHWPRVREAATAGYGSWRATPPAYGSDGE